MMFHWLRKKTFLISSAALLIVAWAEIEIFASDIKTLNSTKVKYLFLFVGEGMGDTPIELAESCLQISRPGAKLFMNRLPVRGKVATLNFENQITDSAVAGTAIACGQKTFNGRLGISANGKQLDSIAELAKRQQLKVGIISGANLNNSITASFFAHCPASSMYSDITTDMATSGFDFFGGGELLLSKDGKRDWENQKLKSGGYVVGSGRTALHAASAVNKNFIQSEVAFQLDLRNTDNPSLAEYTAKAIELLDNPNGFFLMVCSGKIDSACHLNDTGSVIHEIFAFDQAVKTALEFMQKHKDETLIVVTADHDTGNLQFNNKISSNGKKNALINQKLSCNAIGSVLRKQSPGDKSSATVIEYLKEVLAVDFSDTEQAEIKSAWVECGKNSQPGDDPYVKVLSHACAIRDRRSGVKWGGVNHSVMPVSVLAAGAGQELFSGRYENTQIFDKMKLLLIK
jgi:alkaline phosphatase